VVLVAIDHPDHVASRLQGHFVLGRLSAEENSDAFLHGDSRGFRLEVKIVRSRYASEKATTGTLSASSFVLSLARNTTGPSEDSPRPLFVSVSLSARNT